VIPTKQPPPLDVLPPSLPPSAQGNLKRSVFCFRDAYETRFQSTFHSLREELDPTQYPPVPRQSPGLLEARICRKGNKNCSISSFCPKYLRAVVFNLRYAYPGTARTFNKLLSSHSRRFAPELRCSHARNNFNYLINRPEPH
jgi:hypothetical protein